MLHSIAIELASRYSNVTAINVFFIAVLTQQCCFVSALLDANCAVFSRWLSILTSRPKGSGTWLMAVRPEAMVEMVLLPRKGHCGEASFRQAGIRHWLAGPLSLAAGTKSTVVCKPSQKISTLRENV